MPRAENNIRRTINILEESECLFEVRNRSEMAGNLFLLPGCAAVSLSAADPRVALLLCEHVSASVTAAASDHTSRAQTTSLPVQHLQTERII